MIDWLRVLARVRRGPGELSLSTMFSSPSSSIEESSDDAKDNGVLGSFANLGLRRRRCLPLVFPSNSLPEDSLSSTRCRFLTLELLLLELEACVSNAALRAATMLSSKVVHKSLTASWSNRLRERPAASR